MKGKPWTDDDVIVLSTLIREQPDLSYREISVILGKPRNSVIGKAHRLGFRGSNRKVQKVVEKQRLTPARKTQEKKPEPVAQTAPAPLTDDRGAHFSILTVRDNQCRYPHGAVEKGDFHYCGHPRRRPGAFCEYHSKIIYVAPMKFSERPRHRTH